MRTAFAPDRILEVRTRWEFDGAPANFGRLSDVVVVDCRAASTRIFLRIAYSSCVQFYTAWFKLRA